MKTEKSHQLENLASAECILSWGVEGTQGRWRGMMIDGVCTVSERDNIALCLCEEGAAERNCCVLTVNHSYHPPCDTQEGDERSPEWRSEVEPGKRRCCFMYVLLFLTTQLYLNWQ